jgi:hypothetical protein
MHIDVLQGCCGIYELLDFPLESCTYRYLKEEFEDWLKQLYNERLSKQYLTTEPLNAIIATTIPSQKIAIKFLRSNGFKFLAKTKNSNTGALISIWFHPPKIWMKWNTDKDEYELVTSKKKRKGA